MKRKNSLTHPLLTVSMVVALVACQASGGGTPTPATSADLPADLQQQLDRTRETSTTSAQNALSQARFAFGNINLRLTTLNPLDLKAYQDVKTQVQPILLVAANALGSDTAEASKTDRDDFKQLFQEVVTRMFEGINNNLQVYQGFFESPQTLSGNTTTQSRADALSNLAKLFSATEITERYITELGQFSTLLASTEVLPLVEGIKNQQTVVINGVINFTSQGASTSQSRQAYQTIAQGLTNPNLLGSLLRLARIVYGANAVAARTEEVTPTQANPNQTLMVVQEDTAVYRLIGMENGKLVNRILNDNRGLVAADILNQTNVIKFSGGTNEQK